MTRHTDLPTTPSCFGLDPVTGPRPEILILGSFPSVLSLERAEYYGNPKNQFWKIMEALFGIPSHLPYVERAHAVSDAGVALWDVVRSCSRPGSADAGIREPVFNDIPGFVASHPTLCLVALNGSTAGRLYSRLDGVGHIPSVVLPSTSPAHARQSLDEKVERWSALKKSHK